MSCTNYTKPEVTGVFKQCTQTVFNRLFHRMVHACKIKQPEMLQLSDLLKPHKKAFNTPYWPEVSMTFWNLKRLELACIMDTLGSTHAINVETQKGRCAAGWLSVR